MANKPTTRDMSDRHEDFLAELYGGRKTKGSGNQFNGQMDGRNRRYEQAHALAWDGKATQGKSIGISREMWTKAVEQSHGEIPLVALRWYGSGYGLRPELDLVALDAHDFAAILADARAYREERR